MDPRERQDDYQESILAALDGRQAEIWTALPGIIRSFDPVAMTAEVLVSVLIPIRNAAGTLVPTEIPPLLDCPVIFPSGGGCTLTFPVKQGDECLVNFASRCIDGWWQSGGIQPVAEIRLHDLSDGFVTVGPRSQPRVLPAVSTTTTQLRSEDGSTYVELDPVGQIVNVVSPGGFTVVAPTINLIGNVATTGGLTNNDVDVGSDHMHTAVQPGGGISGPPVT